MWPLLSVSIVSALAVPWTLSPNPLYSPPTPSVLLSYGKHDVNVMQNNGRHAGQIVGHLHFHIIPRFPDDKVIITYQRVQADENALNEMQQKLKIDKIEEKPAEPPKKTEKEKLQETEQKRKKDWEMEF